MGKFLDVGGPTGLPEDDRIDLIVEYLKKLGVGRTVAVLVDDEPGKADRYIKKIKEKYSRAEVKSQGYGPTPGCYTVIIWVPPSVN